MVSLVGKFAKVNTDAYEKYDLPSGTLVFIAGSGFSPVDDDDNYKLLYVVAKVGEDGVPAGDKGVTIARKSLDVLSHEDLQNNLKKMEDALARKEKVDSEEGSGTTEAVRIP